VRILAAGFLPESRPNVVPLSKKRRRNAGCALHPGLVAKCVEKGAHEHTGSAETLRHPAQWLYGLYRALPVERLVVTVTGGILPAD